MKKKIALLITTIALVGGCFVGCGGEKYSKLEWPSNELTSLIPEPKSNVGEIHSNSDSDFYVTIAKVSKDDYQNYFDNCKDIFSVGWPSVIDNHCSGYNEDDIELVLSYDEKKKTMDIRVMDPQYDEFKFPNSDLAKMIPIPKSTFGKIEWETSDGFIVYVANTSKSEYSEYVEVCKACGFTVDYTAGDYYYYAENSNGYDLSLRYRDTDVMRIELDVPSEDEKNDSPSEDATSDSTTSSENVSDNSVLESTESNAEKSGTDSQFKEALDSYEDFVDHYCDFMKRYSESTNTAAMMSEYAEYLQEYSEVMDKINAIDTSNLTPEELAYYTEVTSRCAKKLSEI